MPPKDPPEDRKDLPESREHLWIIAAAPAIWSVYFVLSYATVAIWCARIVGLWGSLDGARILVAIYTVVTLVAITLVGIRGFRQHSYGNATLPHDFDTDADRHRFIGFATVLLAGLSFVETLYVALAAVFIGICA